MSLTISATSSTVAVTGSLSVAKTTAQCLFTSQTANTAVTMGTVPALKVWRIIGMAGSVATDTSVNPHECIITLAGNDVWGIIGRGFATYGGSDFADSISFSYSSCPVLTAGQTVVLKARTATINTCASVFYVEEDA